nr:endopeptidase, NLPC/P60 domain, LRAT-like domain protein [Tanacetum cinerariifolium]
MSGGHNRGIRYGIGFLNEFIRKNFKKRTKDMLSSKWSTLNHNCQKFNAIYKVCHRLKKSDENEVDLLKRARGIYRDENKNNTFNHEDAWAILRKHSKWEAPDPAPVDLTEGESVPDEHVPAPVNTDELFGPDARPRPPGKQRPGKKQIRYIGEHRGSSSSGQFGEFMTHELRLKRKAAEKAFEVSKEKDRTVTRLEELRFLALRTKDLSDYDAYYINL